MKKRMFSFGCSGTFGTWATASDFIGASFDEYHNLGRGGACNEFIMNRMIEANNKYNFNSETDFVMISITNIGRFSFMDNDGGWRTQGDLALYTLEDNLPGEPSKPLYKELKSFVDTLWNYQWLVYRTWIAVKTIKAVLESKNVKHKFVMALDNLSYLKTPDLYELSSKSKELIREIYDIVDIKESYGEFMVVGPGRKTVVYNDGTSDGHPTQTEHFEYACKHFPDMITDKSRELYDFCERNFDWSSIKTQPQNFEKDMALNYPHMKRHLP